MIRNGSARWLRAAAASLTIAFALGAAPAQAHDRYGHVRVLDSHGQVRCLSNYLGLRSHHLDLLPCTVGTELLLWRTTTSPDGTTELHPEWNTSQCLRPGPTGSGWLGWTGDCGAPSTKWRISGTCVTSFRGECLGEVSRDQAGPVPCGHTHKGRPAH